MNLQGTFSLKTFVGPTPNRQRSKSHGTNPRPQQPAVLRGSSQRTLSLAGQCGLAEAILSYMSSEVVMTDVTCQMIYITVRSLLDAGA